MAKIKMKTKSSAKKRFRVTGKGKIKRAKAYKNHILEHQSPKQGRRLRKTAIVDSADVRAVKRMLVC